MRRNLVTYLCWTLFKLIMSKNSQKIVVLIGFSMAVLNLFISIFFVESLRVSATIFFCSALGITIYHFFLKGSLVILKTKAAKRLLAFFLLSTLCCIPFFFILPMATFKIVVGAIISVGGLLAIYDLGKHVLLKT